MAGTPLSLHWQMPEVRPFVSHDLRGCGGCRINPYGVQVWELMPRDVTLSTSRHCAKNARIDATAKGAVAGASNGLFVLVRAKQYAQTTAIPDINVIVSGCSYFREPIPCASLMSDCLTDKANC